MSDVMNRPLPADNDETAVGHGRHRGEVSTQDDDTAPRGRHRRPDDASEPTST